jgi:hypothetical protein
MSRTNKLKLFGGASIFALAAALGGTVEAAPVSSPSLAAAVHSEASKAISAGDPLVELTLRCGGHLTPEKMAALLPSVIGPITAEKAEMLPRLMGAIRGLGVGHDVEAVALETMTSLIADAASGLDEGRASQLVIDVADRFAAKVQLAKVQNNPGTGKASDTGKSKNHNNDRGNGTYSG